MTSVAEVVGAALPVGWTVHVELQLASPRDHHDPAEALAVGLVARSSHRGAAVVVVDDVVCVTVSQPRRDDVRDAGQALVRGLDAALDMVTAHVEVDRVRHARVAADDVLEDGAVQGARMPTAQAVPA